MDPKDVEIEGLRRTLWCVLRAAAENGIVRVPKDILERPYSSLHMITRAENPDGSVTYQAFVEFARDILAKRL